MASMSSTLPSSSTEEVQGNFDWISDYHTLRPFFTPDFLGLGLDARVLIVGCGTSTLSEHLYNAGFHNIVNIDIDAKQVERIRFTLFLIKVYNF